MGKWITLYSKEETKCHVYTPFFTLSKVGIPLDVKKFTLTLRNFKYSEQRRFSEEEISKYWKLHMVQDTPILSIALITTIY